ncbi:MAG: alpha-amylase family glycosyl hydrolase [Deltaproteobacteria bacterium]|nr:alpha-amylase family glycosyl hydrolase [Deltaproteobacteria bacterium]
MKECLFGLPDFRTEREDVRQFLVRKYKELAKRAGFDGVRIDAMKHFDSKLVIELRKEFTKINTDMIFIGEYWGSAPDEKWMSVFSEYNVDFLFDFEFRDYLSGFLRGVMRPEVFVSYLNRRYNFAEKGFIVFLNNHDMDGLITHFDDINEKDEGNLLRIMALMQFVSGGAPLIYYGEENGIRVGKGIENRRDMQFSERVMGLRSFYKRLVSLKKKGMLSGKFSAKYENGLLIINIGNMYGEIKAIVNRDRNEKEFQINGNYIKVPSLDCLLIKSDSGGMEYLIPH